MPRTVPEQSSSLVCRNDRDTSEWELLGLSPVILHVRNRAVLALHSDAFATRVVRHTTRVSRAWSCRRQQLIEAGQCRTRDEMVRWGECQTTSLPMAFRLVRVEEVAAMQSCRPSRSAEPIRAPCAAWVLLTASHEGTDA